MSANLKIIPFVISLFFGISITFASFAYQKMGSEMDSYGNAGCEVQLNSCIDGQMMGKVLGAGFPLQYVLDNIHTSVWYSIGLEDNFKILPFLMDVLFYTVIIYGSIKFTQSYKRHSKKQPAKITA
jgi:hypothetical protein